MRALARAALGALTLACARPVERAPSGEQDFEEARRRMVADQIEARGVRHPGVLDAMRSVPRHEFVPAERRALAYEDMPLPIGLGQTISQPYVVALMTELLDPEPGDRILEVGTGSGYQAAVAARLVAEVYTIEIVPELARSAAERLERLGVENVRVREGDGYLGWPEEAPFDGILVTAGADEVPPPLVEQLAPGGRMVIPVGDARAGQVLRVLEKLPDGEVSERDVLPVRFVPLTRRRRGVPRHRGRGAALSSLR
ncbi:MAG TPA: protein-L-isoaspartate(D-aspartate) O-methyltransferase [Longimicrobiales bacterium]|nr:protein-L-isoaspartate(D-aspartate) O-methyltransferase [Longimicrobiales bacterium]